MSITMLPSSPIAHIALPPTAVPGTDRVIVTPPAEPGELARAYGSATDGAGNDSGYALRSAADPKTQSVTGSFDDAVQAAHDLAQSTHLVTRVHKRLFGYHDLPVNAVAIEQAGSGWNLTQVGGSIDPAQVLGSAWGHKMWMGVAAPPLLQRSQDDVVAMVGWSRWFDLRGPRELHEPTTFG